MHNSDDMIATCNFGVQRLQAGIPVIACRRLNWGDSDTAAFGQTQKFSDFAIKAIGVWWEAVLGRQQPKSGQAKVP